jgi:alkylation response protein AidB-like acyl-CoA dehydrogenase
MDFTLPTEAIRFRDEVEAFVKSELPPGFVGHDREDGETLDLAKDFTDKLAKRGWLAPAWPVEYGGLGLGYWEQTLYNELMAYYRAPMGQSGMGVSLIGPTLIIYGTEEQKKEHLGAILRNEQWWAQGFSEPNSGSDLASLSTRAVEDGDDFVVNGSKIWTSGAQYASMIFMLVRTDPEAPKHRGISFIVADLKSPGIRVQPLTDLADHQPFNQTFFEDVRVPKKNLVGELNRGWYVAVTTLDFERSGVEWAASARRLLKDAIEELKEWRSRPGGPGPLDDPIVSHKLAGMQIEAEVARWLAYRVTAMQATGLVPNHEASISKVFGSEMNQRLARTLVDIYDLYGGLREDSPRARLVGRPAMTYMQTVPVSIFSGSSEIQRNVIATRGLGLPRG